MTPEYMFQKFELVLFLLTDITAYLITPLSQLRLQDKLNISDGSVFRIQQELGPVGGNDRRLVLYKMFVGLLQDVGMLKMCEMLRSAYHSAYDYNRHYKKVVQNMHRYMALSDKQDADWIVSLIVRFGVQVCQLINIYCFGCIVDLVVLVVYYSGCVDRSGSLSGGAFNQLRLATLNLVLTILY